MPELWAWRTFELQSGVTKSSVYNEAVTDAAMECITEVVEHFRTPDFQAIPSDRVARPVASARSSPA